MAAAPQVTENQHSETELQHSGNTGSNATNTFETVTVSTSQQQCATSADIAMQSVLNTSQHKTGVIVISEDGMHRYLPTTMPYPKPKSRKKNNVSRRVFKYSLISEMVGYQLSKSSFLYDSYCFEILPNFL